MKITLDEFLALPDQEQYDIIFTIGDYLDLKLEESIRFMLYAVDLFFVEDEYDNKEKKIVGKRVFVGESYWINISNKYQNNDFHTYPFFLIITADHGLHCSRCILV